LPCVPLLWAASTPLRRTPRGTTAILQRSARREHSARQSQQEVYTAFSHDDSSHSSDMKGHYFRIKRDSLIFPQLGIICVFGLTLVTVRTVISRRRLCLSSISGMQSGPQISRLHITLSSLANAKYEQQMFLVMESSF